LKKLTGEKIRVSGSGRTDAGVHAENQTASFILEKLWGEATLLQAMNALLPEDIVVKRVEEMPLDFHARFHAQSKVYCYRIRNSPVRPVIDRHYCWHFRPKLDLALMRAALACLLGRHDFSAFCGTGSVARNHVRTLLSGSIENIDPGLILITLEADGFLKHMVRNIVGTLVDVGRGRTDAAEVPLILTSRDRRRAGPTAPARGLFLQQVKY
jgi:tRNA pseudouridine38-40 synthase